MERRGRRPRPSTARGRAVSSFPSDHTAVAFADVAALWLVRRRLAVWLGVLGAALGVTRVIAGVHYPGDVFGGAVVGVASAALLWWAAARPVGALSARAERLYELVLAPGRRIIVRRA